jgi:hypothetical protein
MQGQESEFGSHWHWFSHWTTWSAVGFAPAHCSNCCSHFASWAWQPGSWAVCPSHLSKSAWQVASHCAKHWSAHAQVSEFGSHWHEERHLSVAAAAGFEATQPWKAASHASAPAAGAALPEAAGAALPEGAGVALDVELATGFALSSSSPLRSEDEELGPGAAEVHPIITAIPVIASIAPVTKVNFMAALSS